MDIDMIPFSSFLAITHNSIYLLEFTHIYLPLWLKLMG
jgi:hypothetical protein